MPLDFPANPSLNDTYSFGGKTWIYNGSAWRLNSAGSINNIPIGNVTPNTGAFTTITATGNVSATGNVTGNYFIGNGSQLTGLPESYGNANVGAYLPTYTGNLAGGNLTIGNITVGSDTIVSANTTLTIDPSTTGAGGTVVIAGNLQVTGTTTTVDSTTVTINDLAINVANNASTASEANGGGIKVGPVGSEYAALTYASTGDKWVSDSPLDVTGNITASYFLGNGSQLAGAKTTVSGSAPSSPSQGDVWIDTDTGKQFIYFNDGNSSQWAEMEASQSFTSTGGGGAANSFSTIDANGTSLIATSSTETLTLTAGNNLTITGNAASDTATFAVSDAPSFTGNVSGANLNTAGLVSATGNITGGNLVTAGVVAATGNVSGGNIETGAQVVATGNITGGNLVTAGVVAATGNVSGGNLIASANVSGLNFLGNIAVANVVGTVSVSQGGTGAASLTSNYVLLGNSTSAVRQLAPGTSGNVLTSNGSAWISQAASGGSTSGVVQSKYFYKSSSFSTTSTSLTEVTGFNATPQITIPAERSTSIVKMTVTTCVYIDGNAQSFPSGYFQLREGSTNLGEVYYIILSTNDATNTEVLLVPITMVGFSSAGSGTRSFNFQAAVGLSGTLLELPYQGWTYIMLEEIAP
jgi:hypothetical protein